MPEHTPAPTFARGVYGFVLYVAASAGFLLYCVWAYMPPQDLYWPHRYWAVGVPLFVIAAVLLFAFCLYPLVVARVLAEDYESYSGTAPVKRGLSQREPQLHDIPLEDVCRKLYARDGGLK